MERINGLCSERRLAACRPPDYHADKPISQVRAAQRQTGVVEILLDGEVWERWNPEYGAQPNKGTRAVILVRSLDLSEESVAMATAPAVSRRRSGGNGHRPWLYADVA